jgi:4'-phosphopantetheinyl transferase
MPLENLHEHSDFAWALWKIDEEEKNLISAVHPFEPIPENITHPFKRLEFLASRVLLKALLKKWNLDFQGLRKDEEGKPFFVGHEIHLSLSHSYPYVAAIIHRYKPVGIDLEQPKEKLLRIGPRVLNEDELNDAGADIVKHCIFWCAKEALIKVYGKRHLVLSKDLAIEPFSLQKQGNLIGRIIANNTSVSIQLIYRVYDNFVVVLNT